MVTARKVGGHSVNCSRFSKYSLLWSYAWQCPVLRRAEGGARRRRRQVRGLRCLPWMRGRTIENLTAVETVQRCARDVNLDYLFSTACGWRHMAFSCVLGGRSWGWNLSKGNDHLSFVLVHLHFPLDEEELISVLPHFLDNVDVFDCFWVLGIRKFWSQKEDKEGKSSEREWNFSGAEVEHPSPSTEAQSCQLCRRLSQKMILVDNGRLRSSSNKVLVSANQALSRTFSYLFWSCSVDTLERTVIISAWILLGPSEALLFAAAAKDTGRQFMDKTWQHHERSKVVSQRWQEHCCVKTSSLETCRLPEEVIPCPTVGDCRWDFAKNVTWTLWNPKPMIHNTVL